MKTKIRGKNLLFICTLFITMLLMAFVCCNLTIQNAYAETISNEIACFTEDDYAIANEKRPNGIELTRYEADYYGKNATFTNNNGFKKIEVKDNDDIIKLIPEELFKKECAIQHFGREYGFFIETRKQFSDNDMLLSTVILFDVIVNDNMLAINSASHLKIKIQPIFQAEFAYIKRGNNEIYSLNEQKYNFFSNGYTKDLQVIYPTAGNEFVVPIPTIYHDKYSIPHFEPQQHNKYYMTNVSNRTSLYNMNDYNPYDEKYNAENDMGCFFTQTDFAYNGVFLENGESSLKDTGEVVYDAAMLACDIYSDFGGTLKSVFKAVPYVGIVVSTLDIVNSLIEIDEGLRTHTISDSKTLSYRALYNNKEQQINNYHYLTKDSTIAITNNTENQLLFRTNDYAEFDYQINCQDTNVDTLYATMINIGLVSVEETANIAPKIGKEMSFTSTFTRALKNKDYDYKEIPSIKLDNLKKDVDLTILPNRDNIVEIVPKYSGYYQFDAKYNSYAKFNIYEQVADGQGNVDYNDMSKTICQSKYTNQNATSGKIFLDSNKKYFLRTNLKNQVAIDNITGRYGVVYMDINFIPQDVNFGNNNVNINSSQNFIKFNANKNANYRFTLNNPNLQINLLNAKLEQIQTSVNGELLVTLNENGTYYLRIDKTENVAESVNLYIRDEMNVTFENFAGINESIDKNCIISSLDAINLPQISKRGYAFAGWWTSLETNGTQVTNNNILNFFAPSLTFYAKWTPIEYNVYYEENGGTLVDDGKYIIEHNVVLNKNISREGYVFGGWFDNVNLSGSPIETMPSGNIGDKTFYAKWINKEFVVTLNVNQAQTDNIIASIDRTNQTVSYDMNYTLPVPVLDGFIFAGWWDGNVKYTDNKGDSLNVYKNNGPIALTAKWEREKYYIRINKDDGSYKWLTKNGNDFVFSDNKNYVENTLGLCPNCYIQSQIAKGGAIAQDIKNHLFKEGHIYQYMVTNKNDSTSLAYMISGI